LGSTHVAKYDLRPEAYGTLDEAAAFIGLARAQSDLDIVKDMLLTIQNHLYLINAELACPPDSKQVLKHRIEQKNLDEIEATSHEIEEKLDLPRKFVLYGQTKVSAILDVARAVVRRAERRIAELADSEGIDNKIILPYINRLSDTLFLLARYEEFAHHVPYAHPHFD